METYEQVVETLRRLEARSRETTEWMRKVETELQELKEENQRRDEDRKNFQKSVMQILLDSDGRCERKGDGTIAGEDAYGRSCGREIDSKLSTEWSPCYERKPPFGSVIRDGTLASSKKVLDERYIKISGPMIPTSRHIDRTDDLSKVDVEECRLFRKASSSGRAEPKNKKVASRRPIYSSGPYTRLTEPVEDFQDMALLEFIFDQFDDDGMGETIIRTELNEISRSGMSCLRPKTYVNGEILNVKAEYLTRDERALFKTIAPNWYLTTRMNRSAEEFMRRHRVLEHFMGQLAYCEKIYVPINHSDHWFLYLFLIDSEVVQIWVSFCALGVSKDEKLLNDVKKNLDTALKLEIKDVKPIGWSFMDFKVEHRSNLPQQPNGYDCGVFVANFMDGRELEELSVLKYNSDDERCRLVLDMVKSATNVIKVDICRAALDYYRQKHGISATPFRTVSGSKTKRSAEGVHDTKKKGKLV
ncbi:Ulp1 protease family, C-terminal catalytic domain containing protein [Trema orientale]|uniref:Ulp1 protease family, C-terminal catalytic domain containing protein n=1 Tax=Trema orientale TaxID=63057 RepID=A0A2P5DWE8_TREOI|nr:Ulp1 protease family, C-terminal catalytic domain containing protein [Trema orientale]